MVAELDAGQRRRKLIGCEKTRRHERDACVHLGLVDTKVQLRYDALNEWMDDDEDGGREGKKLITFWLLGGVEGGEHS